jgi:broad specificity phosphatase PhoE
MSTTPETRPELYLLRHGETEWSKSGQHTGRTDIPLTENGRAQAKKLSHGIAGVSFVAAFASPLQRASETAKLLGLANAVPTDDLLEFDYGEYEGITTPDIRKNVPDWTVWSHPCPKGETLDAVALRAKRFIQSISNLQGKVAVVSHGHFLRILTATWLKLDPSEGRHFILDTTTLSILSYEREATAIKLWNSPVSN